MDQQKLRQGKESQEAPWEALPSSGMKPRRWYQEACSLSPDATPQARGPVERKLTGRGHSPELTQLLDLESTLTKASAPSNCKVDTSEVSSSKYRLTAGELTKTTVCRLFSIRIKDEQHISSVAINNPETISTIT